MNRLVTVPVLMVVVCALLPESALAQFALPTASFSAAERSAPAKDAAGELYGIVVDDTHKPLSGVVVSATGATTKVAVTDESGQFVLRGLSPGSYLVRAHLHGYGATRSTVTRIASARRTRSSIMLTKDRQILIAGVAGEAEDERRDDTSASAEDDHSELAWRLRHLKRSILRDAGVRLSPPEGDDSFLVDSLETVGRAIRTPARVASALVTESPFSGQLNLLTSFDRPQDLFAWGTGRPHGVAYLSLVAPMAAGRWAVLGAMTENDVASWLLAGSFARRAPSRHEYEAGWFYTTQQYVGGNVAALAALPDGKRNAGAMYVYDNWRIAAPLTVSYGARYSRYDYLDQEGLFAPRVAVTVRPVPGLRVRAAASHTEIAPGAEEFQPPSEIGVWLPPERTFSPLAATRGFHAERVHHFELAVEHDVSNSIGLGVRVFRQQVDEQLVTLFGVALSRTAAPDIGHYYVANAGDLVARGWSVSASHAFVRRVRGSVGYTQARANWIRRSPDADLLTVVASNVMRLPQETLHDLTTSVDADVPVTSTRMTVVYALKTAALSGDRLMPVGVRFDVEVRQALPFLGFTNGRWAMLLAVRNRFHEEGLDASIYDELLVLNSPRRVVGGLTVQF